MPTKPPKNIEELRNRLFQRTWKWYLSRSRLAQVMVVVLTAAAGILGARAGYLGSTAQALARAIPPRHIPYIDPSKARPALTVTFDAGRDGVGTVGRNGSIYRTGDEIVLKVTLGSEAWTLVFCVDSRGYHSVTGPQFRPVLLQGGTTHHMRFQLDDTTGVERYITVVAAEPFTFDGELRHALRRANKGPLMHDLPLDERFAQQTIWFTHVAR